MSDVSISPAIDSHGHFGAYVREGGDPLADGFMSADGAEVVRRATESGIGATVVSPLLGLLPRGRADAFKGNAAAFKVVAAQPGLLQYVIVNPLQPATYAQAREMLSSPLCVGVKLHPEEHGYRIADRGRELFEFLEETGAPAMTHSGCPNSLPADFVSFANDHPTVRLLLAHLGNAPGHAHFKPVDLQVRAVQAARHRNLWVDTSSARSIVPNLIEWAVGEIGAERILFGTDTPLYHTGMQKNRIDLAQIGADERRLILRENALRFFSLSRLSPEKGRERSVAPARGLAHSAPQPS